MLKAVLAMFYGENIFACSFIFFRVLRAFVRERKRDLAPDLSATLDRATIEWIGALAATITTLCWVPQAWRVIRTRDTKAISLLMYLMLSVGLVLWLVYGLLLGSMPLIIANTITLALVMVILAMKLRYG
jgi:MtN3 and saliva related transmembrane protein